MPPLVQQKKLLKYIATNKLQDDQDVVEVVVVAQTDRCRFGDFICRHITPSWPEKTSLHMKIMSDFVNSPALAHFEFAKVYEAYEWL